MRKLFYVVDPLGKVHKCSSQNRIFTHCVLARIHPLTPLLHDGIRVPGNNRDRSQPSYWAVASWEQSNDAALKTVEKRQRNAAAYEYEEMRVVSVSTKRP